MSEAAYVMVTAAFNEAEFTERTIKGVVGQTAKPMKWVIVDDFSTDETAEIVRAYAE